MGRGLPQLHVRARDDAAEEGDAGGGRAATGPEGGAGDVRVGAARPEGHGAGLEEQHARRG